MRIPIIEYPSVSSDCAPVPVLTVKNLLHIAVTFEWNEKNLHLKHQLSVKEHNHASRASAHTFTQ